MDGYWLDNCEGFAVTRGGRRLGLVEEVLRTGGCPRSLVVRTGLFGRRAVLVPLDHVEDVAPRRRLVLLAARGEAGRGERAAA